MKDIKVWLIEKNNIQNLLVLIVIMGAIISRFIIDKHTIHTYDFYTPILFLLLIIWVYFSTFFVVSLNNNTNEKTISRRKSFKQEELYGKFLKVTALILVGSSTFNIFGKNGVLVSLILTSLTALLSLFISIKEVWTVRQNEKFVPVTVLIIIIGYIYFIPWKNAYCHQFGVEEIGHYFEKDTYNAKYLIEATESESDKTYTLPADIIISKEYSDYVYEDTESGIGPYSYESSESTEIRFAKINRVYIPDSGFLFFKNCLVTIDNSMDCPCYDQNDKEWKIEFTKSRAK